MAPVKRLEKIMERAAYITNKHNKDANFTDIGAYIAPELVRVPGRVLPPPAVADVRSLGALLYLIITPQGTSNPPPAVRNGGWNMSLYGGGAQRKLLEPVGMPNGCVAVLVVQDAQRGGSSAYVRCVVTNAE